MFNIRLHSKYEYREPVTVIHIYSEDFTINIME